MKAIIIGADHAGYQYKELVKKILDKEKIPYKDLGSQDPEAEDDYPDFAKAVGERVVAEETLGILVCGSGLGMAMAANKVRGVRAAFVFDEYSAKMAREDDDANIMTLRGRHFPEEKLKPLILTFLKSKFSGEERHRRRLAKIAAMEK